MKTFKQEKQEVEQAILHKAFGPNLSSDLDHRAFMDALVSRAVEICSEKGSQTAFVDSCVLAIRDFLIASERWEDQ